MSRAQAAEDLLWVADFNEGKLVTKMNGGIGAWQFDPNDKSSWCDAAVSPEEVHFGEPGNSMKIEYNIATGKENYVTGQNNVSAKEVGFHGEAFNGVYILLHSLDVTRYNYLVFSARGDAEAGFSRKFKLELKDQERVQSISFDKLTSKWQKFHIPLGSFGSTLSLKELKEIVFVFDRNMTRPHGAMYVDDIYFSKSKTPEPEPAVAAGQETAFIAPPAKPTVIDGDLSEWPAVRPIVLGPKNLEFGEVRSRADLAAEFRFAWDKRYLYFAATVKDNDLVGANTGKEIYKDDVLELFIDPDNDGLVWSSAADFQLGFALRGADRKPQVWAWFQGREPSLEEVVYDTKLTRNGYVLEAAIKWEFLNVKPEQNLTIGISPAVHDVDRKKKKKETKLNWRFAQNPADSKRYSLGALRLGER